ncbi:MAG: fatty acid desaturase [Stigonema ocellatum SAG 48.90 = DSM 106950]|nr:fatty acid desaturase [Stigonema ocellatum SAG 48.90 = DSM 106950]
MRYSPKDKTLAKELVGLYKSSTFRSVVVLVEEWLIICFLAWISLSIFAVCGVGVLGIFSYLGAILIIASRQRVLENFQHDALHFNLSRNHIINDMLAWVFIAVPSFHHINNEREAHCIGHHKHYWQEGLDPDLLRYQQFEMDKLQFFNLKDFWQHVVRQYPKYYATTIGAFYLYENDDLWSVLLRIVPWVAALIIAWFSNVFHIVVLFWLVPLLVTLPIVRYLSELTEHAGLTCSTEPLTSARNSLGLFNELFLHPRGEGFHQIHHMYPSIPWFNLRKAHALLMQDEEYCERTCTVFGFIDTFRSVANIPKS